MQKLRENKDLIKIAAVLLAFVLLFLYIKIYPTIEAPLIKYEDEASIFCVDLYEDAERVASWFGPETLTDDLEKEIIKVLSFAETTRSFESQKSHSLDDARYCIRLDDGKQSKVIWLGAVNFCDVDNKAIRYINEPEALIAELDALLSVA